jgi:hypothetical protein
VRNALLFLYNEIVSTNNYTQLLSKLDRFIRKYYKNQVLKGLLYSVGLVVIFFLTAATLEYFGNFNTTIRTGLFYSLLLSSAGVIAYYIVVPLFNLFHLGKVIDHKQAAVIVGKHFPSIQDKLLNTLQLEELNNAAPSELLLASIDQKINQLAPIPFTDAVDFRENKKYLKYALPPLAILLVLIVAAPTVLTDSTNRLVRHNDAFEPVAPFNFVIENSSLETPSNQDFDLSVRMEGAEIPDNVYLVSEGHKIKMRKSGKFIHNHLFNSIQKDVSFAFEAAGFKSELYQIKVLPNPLLLHFEVLMEYPKYLNRENESFKNLGNINVPQGTKITWRFNTKDVEKVKFWMMDSLYLPEKTLANRFEINLTATNDNNYAVGVANQFVPKKDSLVYRLGVIKDLFPSIDVEERIDSASLKIKYFNGLLKDDYGFSRLTFSYRFVNSINESKSTETIRKDLPYSREPNQQQFFHFWDLSDLNIDAGDEIEYYFEVWDNDGINGAKSSRSKIQTYKAPTLDDLEKTKDESNEKIKSELEKAIKEARDLQKEIDELSRDLHEKKEVSWQDKKKLENLIKQQQQLQNRIEKAKNENKKSNSFQEEFKSPDQNILEKQKRIEELFEEVMSEEMKEMMEKLQELMDKLDKNQIQEQLEEMQWDNKDVEKELDRMLEQFKQLEFEQKIEEAIEKLEKLAEEQEKLAEETEKKADNNEALKEKQDELNKKFEELRKEMDELEKKNEELENPNDLESTEEKEEEIQKDMEKSSEDLQNDKNKKASESQKGASEKMQDMANKLSAMMAQSQQESQEEDMDALRALLENIVQISFDQEGLMASLSGLDNRDPKYTELTKDQKKLKDDAKMVEDSLFALSKRVPQLEGIVNREISTINQNMVKAIDNLAERQTSQASSNQQYVMTSLNNLALLLDEALQQMQQQMANKMPGTGNCQKPGGKGSSPANSKEMQDAMGKKLAEMQKKLESGGKNKGKTGSGGQDGMSKELAKMAAEQAAIRKEVERMSQELNKDGSGAGKQLGKLAQEMEEIEKDIVNKNITPETLKRNQDILVRLLESEKAEREREKDNKRESNEAKDYSLSNPASFFEYNNRKEREIELLKTVPPTLKPYYKNKVNEYFIKFEE